mmetsp:Transcript_15563/g.21863  ORF Transcript_15563/g.21863 Transcript_15563/m.21863 type:complete len:258 (+) Transcript_15563:1422-2195(+)
MSGDKAAEGAHKDTQSRDEEREHQSLPAQNGASFMSISIGNLKGRSNDNEGSTRSFSERTEQVGTHTGDITNIVANVVSNSGGVARVVLGNTCHNLARQVGTNISSFSVDATANTAKHSNRRTAKTKASHAFEQGVAAVGKVELLFKKDAEKVQHQKCKTAKRKTHDSTGTERRVEGILPLVVGSCRDRCASVGKHSDLHADVSRDHGSDGAGNKRNGGKTTLSPLPLFVDIGGQKEDNEPEHNHKDCADAVLSLEK